MNEVELCIERTTMALNLKRALEAKNFKVKSECEKERIELTVTHVEAKGWRGYASVLVEKASDGKMRNVVAVEDGERMGYSMTSKVVKAVIALFNGLRHIYSVDHQRAVENEKVHREWNLRQQKETASLQLPGIVAAIIRTGTYAGCYTLHLHDGHPLEHLTLDHYRKFHAFIKSLE